MIRQAAELEGQCENCGAPRTGWAVQLVQDGELRWEEDWQCTGCQVASCDRGQGAPAWIRDEILARHGAWCLTLTDESVGGGVLLKAFRDALGFSIGEAQEAARAMRESGYEGTYVEMTLVAGLLNLAPPVSTRDP
ncbi:hypothetical protein SK854_22095 [Lentzea sp. BCCO 10_0061]|uniref:Uncharacterized protein n=1 Tax=Lentzea sokolovensis TaxID=3095429 RepID=A0ABU4UZ75_9PSEU|nr:hypothetical protein [Lentzea sp. BCCO 10_0061]MDX8144820.1 hypothetical protein [Lentzea sp. BCCO 10_0061]